MVLFRHLVPCLQCSNGEGHSLSLKLQVSRRTSRAMVCVLQLVSCSLQLSQGSIASANASLTRFSLTLPLVPTS